MIYITSDLHVKHNKDFLFTPRGFNSIEEHDAALVKNWNEIITEEDEVYILGDSMMGADVEGAADILGQLKGKIHYLIGNHDTSNKMDLYDSLGWEFEGYSTVIKLSKNWSFYLCHYPTNVNNDDNKRFYTLCGHTHTQDKWIDWNFSSYHCELDAHNMRPVSIDKIKNDIIEKTS